MLAIQILKSQPSPFGLFMYYAIMGQDVKNSLDKRKSARTAHLDRLNEAGVYAKVTVKPFKKVL